MRTRRLVWRDHQRVQLGAGDGSAPPGQPFNPKR